MMCLKMLPWPSQVAILVHTNKRMVLVKKQKLSAWCLTWLKTLLRRLQNMTKLYRQPRDLRCCKMILLGRKKIARSTEVVAHFQYQCSSATASRLEHSLSLLTTKDLQAHQASGRLIYPCPVRYLTTHERFPASLRAPGHLANLGLPRDPTRSSLLLHPIDLVSDKQ